MSVMIEIAVLAVFTLFTFSANSLSWRIQHPGEARKGSPAILEWAVSLTTEETLKANRFSLIVVEREMFLYSNRWQVMVVKQFSGGALHEVGNKDTFDVIPGNYMTLKLNNVTDTDATRFRCSFLSSFSAPKSIITVEIKDLPIKVRLIGGTTPNKGRVEVYHNGYWGSICSDGWDIPDASVVCRMLSFAGAWTAGCCTASRRRTGPVWLSELSCTGTEASLAECGHSGWGLSNCDHAKDAEVICHSPPTEKTLYSSVEPTAMRSTSLHPSTTVTGILTSLPSHFVVQSTSQLTSLITHTSFSTSPSSSFTEVVPLVPSPSSSIVVSTTSITPGLLPVLHVELLDDLYGFPNQGRVILYYNGQWGTVCDDSWDKTDAHVVCRMLGYPRAIGFTTDSAFGGARDGPIWLDEVNCTGHENTLAVCAHDGWGISDCDHTEDAGVICEFNYTVDAKDASCNFETWYCGWDNGPGDSGFKWIRHFGSTPSHGTGPSRDHTSGQGYYFYIEASGNPHKFATLESPWIQSNGNSSCLVFYYHMYGQSINSLRVKVRDQVLFQISGNQGNNWYKATVPLNFDGTYKVSFEGVTGYDARSDIAIDDVEFQENTVCAKTAETFVPSRIVWISTNQTADLGGKVTLGCTATGRPSPRVVWKRNGRIVLENYATANLTISSISPADRGIYECSAINTVVNDTKSIVVNVEGSPKETIITTNVSYNVAALGEHLAIQCSSNGFPVPVCLLYFKGNLLSVNASVFVIQNFTAADQGEYTCNCSNVAGVDKVNITIYLYDSPSIHTIFPAHQLVNETSNFTIFCNATGYPPPVITWKNVGDSSKEHPTGKTLRLLNADKSDFGTYQCTAMSMRGENATAEASVELDCFSPVLDNITHNVTVLEKERQNVILNCNSTGRPTPRLSWIRVKEGKTVAIGNTLVIASADRTDRGEYRCVADNAVGNPVSGSTFLDVYYAPSSTRLITDKLNAVVRGNGHITLTCLTDANPPSSQYLFYHNGVYLRTSLAGKHEIQKAKHSDAGAYLCEPLNRLGAGTNSSVVVSVYGAFSIIQFPGNTTVNENGSATFFCNATSYPPHESLSTHITWSKLGDRSKHFPPGEKLVLQNVGRHDAGTYICKAENGLGLPDTAPAVLNVLHKPYDTVLQASVPDNVGVINSSVILTCSAHAYPPVTAYNIYHNGILVSNSSTGIYNITRALGEHNGSYICIPYNDVGRGESATLNVTFVGPCGVKRVHVSWSPQIVGGVAAKPGEWPWQVQLGYTHEGEKFFHICGASILDHYWIVTAAHCIESGNVTKYNVTVGELHRGIAEGSEQNIAVENVIVHEHFNHDTYENDIALIKLKRPILFNAYVSPICLPKVDFAVGTTCYVTGWGRLGPLAPPSDVLQETTVPLLDHGVCRQYYSKNNINGVTSDMRCAGALGQSQGTCKADSGGPLACERDGRWFLLGITSWTNGGCMDQGDPGVFANTFYFRNWIKDNMKPNTRTRV